MIDNIPPGTIVWARLGPRGQYKKRPAVILSSLDADGHFFVIVGSSLDPINPADGIEIPWNPSGHCRTKMRKRSILDRTWVQTIRPNDIEQIGGILPGTTLAQVYEAISKCK